MTKADLWQARLVHKTLRRDQREAIAEDLALAGERPHNADAVRTAKKNESCGEATLWRRINPSPHLAPPRAGLSLTSN